MKRFAIAALTALSLCGVAVEAKPQTLAMDATGAGLLVQAKELTKSGARIKARKIYEGKVSIQR